MQTLSRSPFSTVKTEGGILPADLLGRIASDDGLPGLRPADYHLVANERLNEAISRSWNRLQGVWRSFDEQRRGLDEADRGTTLTRERWLLILFQELGYGRLPFVGRLTAGEGEDAAYPISHAWQHIPIHLVSFRQDLDRRDPAVGRSPHSLLQEFLNRSESSLWGFTSNGLRLRLLRDNASLTRAAYVEFDLEAMMAGELYSDFSLLWLLCHESRVELHREDGVDREDALSASLPALTAADCWLERWSHIAGEQGARALDALRDGVQEAIIALGRGFLRHKHNTPLRERLTAGELSTQDYYRQLLRLVYRLIFLLVAEDRDLLLAPRAASSARQRYQAYSLRRLRDLSIARRGGPHPDLYRGLRLVMRLLRAGYEPLALPGLGGFLFSKRSTPDLDEADIANRNLLDAIRTLAFAVENGVRRPVDYRNLDTEELGSVYESLLELHPEMDIAAGVFTLEVVAASERRTTGSYYTPRPLILSLLDSALDPVIAGRLAAAGPGPARERALLDIKVIDPAAGSGHFLIAAGHRLAAHLARLRTGDEEPAPEAIREAMRDVVRHCLYGVDINEMAVELCKVALWMESLQPGKPLTFLDKNIQCGNSLIGVAPGLDISEIPDDAFQPVTGDDRGTATALRRRNRRERSGQGAFLRELFDAGEATAPEQLQRQLAEVDAIPEDDPAEVALKAMYYEDYLKSAPYRRKKDAYDLWNAAFFWPIPQGDAELMAAPTQATLSQRRGYASENDPLMERARAIAAPNRFFHWEMAFPTVFGREGGGFDVVLSNPPWERIKLQDKEWFASRRPEIAAAPNAAARKRMIEALQQEEPLLYAAYLAGLRAAESESAFIRHSGRYPLCGRGDINTYAIFAELTRQLLDPAGRAGIIVPSGIATDDTTKFYFQDIMAAGALASLYDFENRRKIFPAVDSRMKFCLLTLRGAGWAADESAQFVFFAQDVADLRDPERRFTLSAADLALLNPNTRTCPIFRSRRDAELTKAIYRRAPVLIEEGPPEVNPWGVRLATMFHMSNDSHLFRTRAQLEAEGWRLVGNRFLRDGEEYLPLYEAKLFHHFDHRWATYAGTGTRDLTLTEKQRPDIVVLPRYWVPITEVKYSLADKWLESWILGWRRITNTTNERTMVAAIIPAVGIGDNVFLILARETALIQCLLANLDSLSFDFIVRQKLGGTNLLFYISQQLPVLPPTTYTEPCPWRGRQALVTDAATHNTLQAWLLPRVLELTYTAWDLLPFAQDVLPALGAHPYAERFRGQTPPPFRWDEARRFLLRCELDAAYFHLYGIARADVDYIMETFPIVKRKDLAAHGEYRTRRVILEIYDAMQQAMDSGEPYQTLLDPPPAHPAVAHTTPPPGWVARR